MATIHFINSGGKADFVLVALIVICFAPWLGKVFQSISKDGLTYREDVEDGLTKKAPSEAEDPSTPKGSPGADESAPPISESEQAFVSRLARERPHVLAAFVRDSIREDPPFNALSDDAKKVLATLWKYQQKYVGPNGEGRWTFIVHTAAPDYISYARGLANLANYGFVGIADSGQVCLTDAGLAYCERHLEEVAKWPHTYDKFNN